MSLVDHRQWGTLQALVVGVQGSHYERERNVTLRAPRWVVATAVGSMLLAMMSVVGLSAHAAAAPRVTIKVNAKSTYTVGQRPVLRIKVRARAGDRRLPARGKVIVKALGKRQTKKLVSGRAKVRLAELTVAGTQKVTIIFKGKGLPKKKVTKKFEVEGAAWNVPDAALRAEILKALDLPEGHALNLSDAAALNNTNGATMHFGSVATMAGLELATNLTELGSFTAGSAQDSLGMDNIVKVNGDFWISNAVQDAVYPKLTNVAGDLEVFNISTERLRSISLPELLDAKSLEIEARPLLTSISLPKLATVRGMAKVTRNPALTGVDLPALTKVTDSLDISSLDTATAIRLPLLADVASLNLGDAPRATVLDIGRLAMVNGPLRIVNMPLLGALTAPALVGVSQHLTIYGLAGIRQLAMPQLQWARGPVVVGLGDDFVALPRDGVAFAFPVFDITQSTSLSAEAAGFRSESTDIVSKWQGFKAHFGVA